MACSDLTGKHKVRAQNVSHSNIKTKRWQCINLQSRRVWVPELGRFVRLNVTTRDLRSIDKLGFWGYLTKSVDRRLSAAKGRPTQDLSELFKKLGIDVVFEDAAMLDHDHDHDHAAEATAAS